MRKFAPLIAILLLAASSSALAQSKMFGKTGPQALTYGLDGWVKFVQKQKGGNTKANTMAAYDFFTNARAEVLTPLMNKIPSAQLDRIINGLMSVLGAGLLLNQAESVAALGGEYYEIEASKREAYSNEVFFLILSKKSARNEQVSGNQFRELIDGWQENLNLTAKDNQSTKKTAPAAKEALKAYEEARTAISKLDEKEGNILRLLLAHYLSPDGCKRPF